MIAFIQNSRKCKLFYSDRKQISGCLGRERAWSDRREGLQKGTIFTGDGYVCYLDRGDSCTHTKTCAIFVHQLYFNKAV